MLSSCRSCWAWGPRRTEQDTPGRPVRGTPGSRLQGEPWSPAVTLQSLPPQRMAWAGGGSRVPRLEQSNWEEAVRPGCTGGMGRHVRESDARTPSLGAGTSPGLPPTLVALNEGGEPPRAQPDRCMAAQWGHEGSMLDTRFLPELCRRTA